MLFKSILKVILGVTIISLIFWNRILRSRQPQEFTKLNDNHIDYYLLISGLSSLVFIILFCFTLKTIIERKSNPFFLKNSLYLKIQELIKLYIIDAPQYVYELLTRNINLKKWIELPASYFTAYFNYPRFFVISFYFAPQLIISLTFFIETCFFHQRIIFIKILSILILFLLAKIIVFIFKNYSLRRLNHFELFFDIDQKDGIKHISLKSPHLLPQHIPLEQIVNQYNSMYLHWVIYDHIYNVMLQIEDFNRKYNPYILLLMHLFFALGWLYLFIFLLLNY